MPFEITSCEPYANSISPALYFNARVENQWGVLVRGGIGFCSVYFNQPNMGRLVGRVDIQIPAISHMTSGKLSFTFVFTREQLFYIDKYKGDQADVNLSFEVNYVLFTGDTNNPILSTTDNGNFRISMSDWHRFTSPWGREAILVPITPEIMAKLEELKKAGLGFRNLEEVIEDSYNIHLAYKTSSKEK